MKLRKMTYTQDGKRKLSEKWYAVWVDFSETLRRLPLCEDRKAAEEAANKINKLNQHRANGENLPPELARYVENMPPALRDRLAEWGILSIARAAAGKALAEHIGDWKAALSAKGNTQRHAELVTSRVSKAFDACGFKMWTDLSASKLQTHLADLRADRRKQDGTVAQGISNQTSNFYLQGCKQFCRWMVKDRRASENPLNHLDGLNVKTDRRHDRRAMLADELRWLLDTTMAGPERYGMSGEARAMLYRLAAESGLRSGELRSLTRSSFTLDGEEPTVTIKAGYAKGRREDTLPLRPDTVALLKIHLAAKMPGTPAFFMPEASMVVEMLRDDLADARKMWLESHQNAQERAEAQAGTFLSYADAAGRVADFHALRHTFISNLASGGVHPKTAQSLARHSTITLTMDRYSHTLRGANAKALEALPDLSQPVRQVVKATGTADATASVIKILPISLSPSLSPKGGFQCSLVESGGVNTATTEVGGTNEKARENACFSGKSGERGIRTPDTGLNPYNGLANRRLQPLGHLSGTARKLYPIPFPASKPLFSLGKPYGSSQPAYRSKPGWIVHPVAVHHRSGAIPATCCERRPDPPAASSPPPNPLAWETPLRPVSCWPGTP